MAILMFAWLIKLNMTKRCKIDFFETLDKEVWIKKSDLIKYLDSLRGLNKIKTLKKELKKCVKQEDENV